MANSIRKKRISRGWDQFLAETTGIGTLRTVNLPFHVSPQLSIVNVAYQLPIFGTARKA
jgi:hypothetical protein